MADELLNYVQYCTVRYAVPGAPLDRGFDRVQLGEEHKRRRRLGRPLRADHKHRLPLLVQHSQQKEGAGRVHRGHQQVGEVEHFGGRVLPEGWAPPTAAGKRGRGGGGSGSPRCENTLNFPFHRGIQARFHCENMTTVIHTHEWHTAAKIIIFEDIDEGTRTRSRNRGRPHLRQGRELETAKESVSLALKVEGFGSLKPD